MKVIYEPKGRAKEYSDLAVNLYNGCSHGCIYCYAPQVVHKKKETFFEEPSPRENIIEYLERDLREMRRNSDSREVLMCFTCDPYQELDLELELTRQAIKKFIENQIKFSILTKGACTRDFDLLEQNKDMVRYGATLVFCNDDLSLLNESGAPVTSERIEVLREAHYRGIKTWVSLEPVWSYADVSTLIEMTNGFVDEYRIGKLNYHPHKSEVNWKLLKNEVVYLCESLGVNYMLKADLRGVK
jgi:DNA repair photolyase